MRNTLNKYASLRSLAAYPALVVALALTHLMASEASAQTLHPDTTVRDVGRGAETWVLLSGTIGGVSGMHRMETRLLARGVRVVTIDVYGLSVDSADVSFAALARRVDATLERLHVEGAHVLGHAHGGGVALRLAALYPKRVAELDLLDVGALATNRTAMMGGAIGLAPTVSRMPGGRVFIRTRLVNGIRENSGDARWFDLESERSYTQPVLDNIGRAVALVERLGKAQEPETVASLVARIHVPVTVILGQSPHPSAPGVAQIAALAPLGSGLHVVRLAGVGHFPHEEAPDQVMRALLVVVASASNRNEQ